jgi:hypothetical protein
MSKYFSFFPQTFYKPTNEGTSLDAVTNIMTRFKMQEGFKTNSSVYYKYKIEDGETPEILAQKVYGDVERHWIILLFNNIVDPQYDWPLNTITLNNFINNKYSANANTTTGETGTMWARSNIHSYYKEITTTYNNKSDTITIQLDSGTYANTVSETSYVTLTTGEQIEKRVTKLSKSYYEYEDEQNENKREIKLLKPEFAFDLIQEFRTVIK